MTNKDNGGPARDNLGRFTTPTDKVRDALALAAMEKIIPLIYGDGCLSHWSHSDIACESYVISDAMLLERAK